MAIHHEDDNSSEWTARTAKSNVIKLSKKKNLVLSKKNTLVQVSHRNSTSPSGGLTVRIFASANSSSLMQLWKLQSSRCTIPPYPAKTILLSFNQKKFCVKKTTSLNFENYQKKTKTRFPKSTIKLSGWGKQNQDKSSSTQSKIEDHFLGRFGTQVCSCIFSTFTLCFSLSLLSPR